jgi:hypothetical protein
LFYATDPLEGEVIRTGLPEGDNERPGAIIRRVQKIRRAIAAAHQPGSLPQPDALKSPGTKNARPLERFVTQAGCNK